jgi:hypothetical protein
MIELVSTIDYETYANAAACLREPVYQLPRQSISIFAELSCTFVVFAEPAELEKIDECRADAATAGVRTHLRQFHQ